MISVFICGGPEFKLARVMEKMGLDAEQAIDEIKSVDRSRKNYHNYYYSHPMVSCTPHIGAQTVEAQKRIGAEIVDIITNFGK